MKPKRKRYVHQRVYWQIEDPLLAWLREKHNIDDNGDPVGAQPDYGWETGYAAGVRHVYREIKEDWSRNDPAQIRRSLEYIARMVRRKL